MICEDKEGRESLSEKEAPLSLIGSSHAKTNIEELVSRMPVMECEDARSEANTLVHYPLFRGSMKQR